LTSTNKQFHNATALEILKTISSLFCSIKTSGEDANLALLNLNHQRVLATPDFFSALLSGTKLGDSRAEL